MVLQNGLVSSAELDQGATDLSRRHQAKVLGTWRHALRGFAARMSEQDAIAMAADPRVAWVEEDGEVHVESTGASVPWGLDRIDQRGEPLDGGFTPASGGAGVNAYIIDTGIRSTHVELAGRVVEGYSAVATTTTIGAQAIATATGRTWRGSWAAPPMASPRRSPSSRCGCSIAAEAVRPRHVISGIDWVTANHVAPAVANISLATDGSRTFDEAVQRSIASGVTYAVAAGNSGVDACSQTPARVSAALTVAATDSFDRQASYSNFGSCVDLYAPGSSIPSAWYTSDTAVHTLSGTSMATPFVTGAAALYLAGSPFATTAQVTAALLGNATAGAISGLGAGSPNRLLFTGFLAVGHQHGWVGRDAVQGHEPAPDQRRLRGGRRGGLGRHAGPDRRQRVAGAAGRPLEGLVRRLREPASGRAAPDRHHRAGCLHRAALLLAAGDHRRGVDGTPSTTP